MVTTVTVWPFNEPEIRFITLQGLQNLAWDSVWNYAGVAKSCLRFGSHLCRGCKIIPWFRAEKCRVCKTLSVIRCAIMQGLQNRPQDSVCAYARYAMKQTEFCLDLCRVCNEGFGVQIVIPRWEFCAWDSVETLPRWEFYAWDSGQTLPRWEFYAQNPVRTLPHWEFRA